MKRGGISISLGTAVGIILVLVFFFVFTMIVMKTPASTTHVQYDTPCEISVAARNKIVRSGLGDQALLQQPLQCKPWFITYEQGDKNEIIDGAATNVQTRTYKDIPSLQQELSKHVVRCWEKMGEGKKWFHTKPSDRFHTTCVPCAEIDIENNANERIDLYHYMKNNHFKPKQKGYNMTYQNFLDLTVIDIFPKQFTFHTNEHTSLMYFSMAPHFFTEDKIVPTLTGRAKRNNLYTLAYTHNKDDDMYYGLMIGPSSSIFSMCSDYMSTL